MKKKAFAQDTRKTIPKLEVIETKSGKLYRVCYGGMCNEFEQELAARSLHERFMDMWRHRFMLNATLQYLASQSDGSCNEPHHVDLGSSERGFRPSSEIPSGRFLDRDITAADDVDDCF